MKEREFSKIFISSSVTRLEKIDHWKEAIHCSLFPLIACGLVNENYEQAVIEQIEKFGPYCILRPGLALIHGPVCPDTKKIGIHVTIVDEPIFFQHSVKPVHILIGVCAPDASAYMELVKELVKLLRPKNIVSQLMKMDDQQVYAYFSQMEEMV